MEMVALEMTTETDPIQAMEMDRIREMVTDRIQEMETGRVKGRGMETETSPAMGRKSRQMN